MGDVDQVVLPGFKKLSSNNFIFNFYFTTVIITSILIITIITINVNIVIITSIVIIVIITINVIIVIITSIIIIRVRVEPNGQLRWPQFVLTVEHLGNRLYDFYFSFSFYLTFFSILYFLAFDF